ncbi:diaminopimelate decarboxylase [Arsenicicoccus dermatophilus]|uniref:diaminopimelate decarboxylase n=1 Tax=Arsenicicoccus dermatophilus TaxID=1076331 RepID=UPI001F4CE150|nr:diaminopimelate decarboxylase [Arsenicicoccus dermatophilus]MCH8612336.1 diaminopimelate decarboxylase [Arsenicicoccus dermatophilus]
MHAHEAGALHAPGYSAAPEWLPWPADVNALEPGLWARTVRKDDEGVLTVADVPVTAIAAEFGTAAYVVDETDFRARARDFREAYDAAFAEVCGGADVYYAGKAFLCTAVARWMAEEGLHLDVCSGGELETALRGGMPAARIGLHGNNKSMAELERAVEVGVGRIVVDSHTEIDRVSAIARERGVEVGVMVRVTAGVEAHTHEFIATAHEDQKFGFSLSTGEAFAACERIVARPGLRLLGLHSHIGSQIFETSGFELSARRVLGLHARVRDELGLALPEIDLGGGFGIAYTTAHDPMTPADLAAQMAEIVARECRGLGVEPPRVSIEPGRAIAGPSTFTLYEVGTVKRVQVDRAASRLYVAVDGGMSDNIRTALYGADYSCTLANRRSDAHPAVSRVVGRHCESGDVIVRDEYLPADVRPGDLIAVPGTGAYCRAMASQYNHTPRPPVVAVRDGRARLVVRRETVEDLLALDVDEA